MDRDAEAYYNDDEHFEKYFEHRAPADSTRNEIVYAFERGRVDGPVLEIGSGEGRLQGIGSPYTAADFSVAALRRFVDPKYARYGATASALPFADASFAGVFTVFCLEHVPRPDLAFAEIDRVLRPGGVAYVRPAWRCVQSNCDGLPVRPYRGLAAGQILTKLMLPLLQCRAWKATVSIPPRVVRQLAWSVRRRPINLRFRRLRPDYNIRWCGDSDAAARIDAHEGLLFFRSRGYRVLQPTGGVGRQLLTGNQPVVVIKPSA